MFMYVHYLAVVYGVVQCCRTYGPHKTRGCLHHSIASKDRLSHGEQIQKTYLTCRANSPKTCTSTPSVKNPRLPLKAADRVFKLAAAAVTFTLLLLLLLSVTSAAAAADSILTPTMVTLPALMMMPVSFMGGSGGSTAGPVMSRGSVRRAGDDGGAAAATGLD